MKVWLRVRFNVSIATSIRTSPALFLHRASASSSRVKSERDRGKMSSPARTSSHRVTLSVAIVQAVETSE